LEEKIAQMQMATPAIDRLGIAAYDWWNEALHGVARNANDPYATVFPQAIGMAASWNTDLHYQMAHVIGTEGRAKHAAALARNDHARYTGIDFWSPNINIFRDPRWGRGQETYGEDPYLTSRMGIAFVKGLQGNDPFYFQTIATPKHFAVHSGPEPLRHFFDAVISDQDLYTTYLPAFEATVKEGHAYSIMSSYNALDGFPNSANPRLLTDILRKDWGFQGYVVSDVDSVGDVWQNHQFDFSAEEASAAAVKAGNDLNSGTTYRALADAVEHKLITEEELNVSVRRLMTARFRLGEFDPAGYAANPYNAIAATSYDTDENDAIAKKMSQQSMVLLKNANNALPLKKTINTIAVIGPNADALSMQYGNYNGTPSRPISILQGIRNAVSPSTRVLYGPGCPLVTERIVLAESVGTPYLFTDASRRTHGLTATYARNVNSVDRPIRFRIDNMLNLAYPDQSARDPLPYDTGLYVKWTGVLVPPQTGDYQLGCAARDAFRIFVDDKLIVDEFTSGNLRSIGNAIHFEKGKSYTIAVEYYHPAPAAPAAGRGGAGGGAFPGGGGGGTAATPATAPATQPVPASAPAPTNALCQLRWTRPAADGSPGDIYGNPLYSQSTDLAKQADAVVLVLGIDSTLEREENPVHFAGFSQGDRTSLDLPAIQENLLKQVTAAAAGKPVILVLTNGSALSVNWANDNVPAILEAWYPGQHGEAVADVLFGDYNPAGRLPVTFYKSVNDLPAFTDYAMVNRTYRYFTKPVLYPFGHGLSYSTFAYSGLTVSPSKATIDKDMKVTVSAIVKNSSAIAGDEVVECYMNRNVQGIDPAAIPVGEALSPQQAALAATPRKMLVGFQRVPLMPGEQKTVIFTVTSQQLSLVGPDAKRSISPGEVTFQVGGTSASGLTQSLTLEGAPAAPTYAFIPPTIETPK
jgi:beta-glucosidase